MAHIDALLEAGRPVLISHAPGRLTDLGGAGKTFLALEYAWRHAARHAAVIWVDASGSDITAALASSAKGLGLERRADEPARITAAAVRAHLEREGPHLLVLDGVDHPWSFQPHLPKGAPVLLTSRRRALDGCTPLLLELPPEADAVAMLGGDQRLGRTLSEVFGRLPLSLSIARKVLSAGGVSPGELLQELRFGVVSWAEDVEVGSWFETWPALPRLLELSLALLESPAVAAMARVAGWLGYAGVPRRLLAAAGAALEPGTRGDADVSVERLYALGLATPDAWGRPIFHPIVAAWSRRSSGSAGAQAARDALLADLQAIPAEQAPIWVEQLRPHLRAAVHRLDQTARPEHMLLALRLAQASRARGLHTDALRICKRALRVCRSDAWSSYLLQEAGHAMLHRGGHKRARSLYRAAQARAERSLGPEHPAAAAALRAVGESLLQQGAARDALEYYRRALAIAERAGGPEHPDVAHTRFDIGRALLLLGQHREALAALESALAAAEAGLGPQSPAVASALSAMAKAHGRLEQHDEAVACLERALSIAEAARGPTHPATAAAVAALSQALHRQGALERARASYARALALMRRDPGDAHPDTATLRFEHGRLLLALGDPTGRQEMREAAAVLSDLLGSEHPMVRAARSWID